MKIFNRTLLVSLSLCTALFTSGCAEVINATTSKPIEMKANTRTMGAKLNDEEIETVAKVNIKKADPQLEHAHVNNQVTNNRQTWQWTNDNFLWQISHVD